MNENKSQARLLAYAERQGIPVAFAKKRLRAAVWRSLWAMFDHKELVQAIILELKKEYEIEKVQAEQQLEIFINLNAHAYTDEAFKEKFGREKPY